MERKFTLLLILFVSFVYNACNEDNDPPVISSFAVNDIVDAGYDLQFENLSSNASAYLWDFGDGTQSTQFEPIKFYEQGGNYTVTLTAYSQFNRTDKDVSSMVITVLPATILDVRVLFNGTNIAVTNCSVRLYTSQQDWANETNLLIEGSTDNTGIIIFYYLDPIRHYIDAYKQDATGNGYYSNWDLDYITDPLTRNQVNAYDIFVEFKPNRKRTEDFKVAKVVKRNNIIE